MRFLAPLTSILVLAGSGVATGGPTCSRNKGAFRYFYYVTIPKANEHVKEICGRLWYSLDDFAGCVVSLPNDCSTLPGVNTTLSWEFHTSLFCKPWMVEKAFWLATGNKLGELHCTDNPGMYRAV